MSIEQERADFEAWLSSLDLHIGNHERQIMFFAYQAGRAALQSQDREVASHRATWAGVTVWIGDKQRSYGVTREKLELSNLDALQIAFDHARRIEGEGE